MFCAIPNPYPGGLQPHALWLQCVGSVRAACAGMPIHQLAFNHPQDPANDPLLLAARTPNWLCFFEASQTHGAAHLPTEGVPNPLL